jgi:PKD repeat protein
MKFSRIASALCALMFICNTVSAQEEYRICDTDVMWQKQLAKNPALADEAKRSLEFFRVYAGSDQDKETASSSVLYVIPVVFHVMHNYGMENISKAQILDAMDILNKSFQKLNDDTGDVIPLFQPIFANCQVEFRLATLDPDGNCTDGINRMQTEFTYQADDNVKSLIDWPSSRYLNIWVVGNIASGAAGYSYYPGIGDPEDGIVIRHDYVGGIGTSNGSNYTERSLTHEVGHWLNLPHTWGSTNTPGDPSNCNLDDGIMDTPNTAGTGNFTCNTAQNTCGFIDNVQNYMDYSSCHKMFTNGQRSRMHAALNSAVGARNNLNTFSNHSLTGTEDGTVGALCSPVADFSDHKLTICAGTSVHFKDMSWGGDVTSWQWTCSGGIPSAPTIANPVVQYNVPGIYDVTLQVSNASGSHLVLRPGLIEVLPDTGLYAVPFMEGFETIAWPSLEWTTENPDNNNAWIVSSAAAATGTESIRLVNQSGNPAGSVDAFITPVLNFTGVTGVAMTFDVAYAQKNASDISSLKVFATNNCGQQWMPRYNKSGTNLSTAPATTSSFVPSALEWRTETVNLNSGSINGKPAVRLKFEFTNNMGNNIYVDNINITGNITGIDEHTTLAAFDVYPNPSAGNTNVSFTIEQRQEVNILVTDITGREMIHYSNEYNSGDHSVLLTDRLLPGIYMITLTSGNTSLTRKLIVQ